MNDRKDVIIAPTSSDRPLSGEIIDPVDLYLWSGFEIGIRYAIDQGKLTPFYRGFTLPHGQLREYESDGKKVTLRFRDPSGSDSGRQNFPSDGDPSLSILPGSSKVDDSAPYIRIGPRSIPLPSLRTWGIGERAPENVPLPPLEELIIAVSSTLTAVEPLHKNGGEPITQMRKSWHNGLTEAVKLFSLDTQVGGKIKALPEAR